MADIVSSEVRSRMMSGIRSKNTKPELLVRRALHRLGFRYSLHGSMLPGKPDLVLKKHKVALFIHGCFWHGHECPLFRLPSTRPEFWQAKIERNRTNDAKSEAQLAESGWRVGVIWECALRGKHADPAALGDRLAKWIRSKSHSIEVKR